MTTDRSADTLQRLQTIIAERIGTDPSESYVAALCTGESDQLLKKIVEEATEVILAASAGGSTTDDAAVAAESADLMFHLMVLLAHRGMRFEQVIDVLLAREGVSGLREKQLRSPANTR